jgi:cobalt-zinc-cadmium efflux system outer membrane protein
MGLATVVGCSHSGPSLHGGHLPRPSAAVDAATAQALQAGVEPAKPVPALPAPEGKRQFDLPERLPGADASPIVPLRFDKDTPKAAREEAIRKAYPALVPVGALETPSTAPVSLGDLQRMAAESSPVLRRAEAEAQSAYGAMIQAGLYPNPTLGYQVDQWQPNLPVPPGASISGKGQQGGFVNQLIKTAGKLKYAQRVAGFDYINALVAVRKARVDVTHQVRRHYFAALTAQKAVDINTALADMSDEVYQLQLKLLAAGQAAEYEPLQLHAQSVLARNAVVQAKATWKAEWRKLAAAVGQPDLPPARLSGEADGPPPTFDEAAAKAAVLESHTDLLTARNTIEQAKANLTLQRATPIPDLQTNQYHQYDNVAQVYQFGVQLGIQLPLFDRNQGNIQQARGRIAGSAESLRETENRLLGELSAALAHSEASRTVAENYRKVVIPNLTLTYKSMVRRYQLEPDKVGFNDLIVVQQAIFSAMQNYQAALNAQWQAVVDLANITQQDELFWEK